MTNPQKLFDNSSPQKFFDPVPSGPYADSIEETAYQMAPRPGSGRDRLRTRSPRPDKDVTGRTYPMANRRGGWWRPLVATLVLVVGFILVSTVLQIGSMVLDKFVFSFEGMLVTPTGFAALNLGLASLIPLSMLIQRWLYGSARELHSVTGRFRWRLMAKAALIVVPAWALLSGFMLAFSERKAPTSIELVILVIVLVTTPLQAAGEEFGFRGLLNRAWAGTAPGVAGMVIGLVVSSAIFMLAHFAFQPFMLLYFFSFGAALAIVAWRTGGLEVPVLIHAVHNVMMFVAGTFMEGMGLDSLATRGEAPVGPEMLGMVGLCVLVAAATWVITALRPVPRTVPTQA